MLCQNSIMDDGAHAVQTALGTRLPSSHRADPLQRMPYPTHIGLALDHCNELTSAVVNGWRAPNVTNNQQYGIGK